MPATTPIIYVGLDIAKDHLDYCFSETETGRCGTTPEARAQFIQRLQQLPGARVVCEASGGYEKLVVAELLAAGLEVCVVQSGRVRAYAQAEGLLAKTDQLDAQLLRRFGAKLSPRLAVPTDPVVATLRELLEHRRQLTTQNVEVQGRLGLAGPRLRTLLETQQTFLQEQLAAVDKMIDEHIDQDPGLKSKSERLQQIKGVGRILAATVLGYVPELGQLEANQLAALIGVAPHPRQSGKRSSPSHIRGGRHQVRHVLYMAATCAARHNPILAQFYQRLLSHGKPAKVCIVAVMRKLVCLMSKLIQNPDFVLVG